jgi:Kef-type K+ transport system membrane component KefB
VSYGTLALVVAVGLLGPLLSLAPTAAAPPIVIGEIAAGVVIGKTGFDLIDANQPTLAFLASIGFALLMFIVGTHIPVRDANIRAAMGSATIAAIATILLAFAVTPLIAAASGLHKPAVIAVLVATSSAAFALPILDEGKVKSRSFLVVVGWIALLDVVTILAIPIVLATGNAWKAILGGILVIVAAAFVGWIAHWAAPNEMVRRLRARSHERGWALDLRVSLLVLFTFAWIAERFDTSVLIAGFAAGVMVALLGEPRRVADQLLGLGEGFFVPLFFVVLGARIDLRALAHSIDDVRLLVLLALAGSLVHIAVAWIRRLPVPYGMLAAAQLGVPSAVASIGLSTGDLRPGQGAAIIGAAAISLAVAAVGATIAQRDESSSARESGGQ